MLRPLGAHVEEPGPPEEVEGPLGAPEEELGHLGAPEEVEGPLRGPVDIVFLATVMLDLSASRMSSIKLNDPSTKGPVKTLRSAFIS